MNYRVYYPIIGATLVVWVLARCGTPAVTSQPLTSMPAPPTATQTPIPPASMPTLTPTAGTGLPVANADWEIVVDGARWEMSLDAGKYRPLSGFAFLIVDITFRNLPSAKETEFDENDIMVIVDNLPIHDDLLMVKPEGDGYDIDDNGEIIRVAGAGSGSSFDLEGNTTASFEAVKQQQRSVVFVFQYLTYVNFPRNWRLVFKDLPHVSFSPARFMGSCAPYCDKDESYWFCFEQHCVPRTDYGLDEP